MTNEDMAFNSSGKNIAVIGAGYWGKTLSATITNWVR